MVGERKPSAPLGLYSRVRSGPGADAHGYSLSPPVGAGLDRVGAPIAYDRNIDGQPRRTTLVPPVGPMIEDG